MKSLNVGKLLWTPKTTKKIKDSFFYISYGLLSHPKNKDVFLIFNKQENIEFYTKNHLKAVTTGGWPHKEKNVFSSWILKRYKKKENIRFRNNTKDNKWINNSWKRIYNWKT